MTTQMTREQCDEVIEYFGHKGCSTTFIGDVLEKIKTGWLVHKQGWEEFDFRSSGNFGSVVEKWFPLCLNTSLQQILAEAEWEHTEMERMLRVSEPKIQPPAAELFEFLHSLIPTK